MKSWSQKIHIYLGLYFLVFLWLFSASGLLLNHHWSFAEFYPQRRESNSERAITPPVSTGDVDRARELMAQLGLEGELEWTTVRPNPALFEFRVSRPGHLVGVKADFAGGKAAIQEMQYNGWGIVRGLHTFNGVGVNAPRPGRDWSLTSLWTFAMDAVAAGIVALVLTSLVLAWLRRDQWLPSGIALALGCATCGLFVFGLAWL
jgi:hypothetical protein